MSEMTLIAYTCNFIQHLAIYPLNPLVISWLLFFIKKLALPSLHKNDVLQCSTFIEFTDLEHRSWQLVSLLVLLEQVTNGWCCGSGDAFWKYCNNILDKRNKYRYSEVTILDKRKKYSEDTIFLSNWLWFYLSHRA